MLGSSSLGGRGSRRAASFSRLTPPLWEGEAPAEPQDPATSQHPLGGRGSRRAARSSNLTTPLWEGEAPAEPQDPATSQHPFGRARLLPSREIQPPHELFGSAGASPSRRDATQQNLGGRGSCRAARSSRLTHCSAQQDLRPPWIAVNIGNAIGSCSQDFALIQKTVPPTPRELPPATRPDAIQAGQPPAPCPLPPAPCPLTPDP